MLNQGISYVFFRKPLVLEASFEKYNVNAFRFTIFSKPLFNGTKVDKKSNEKLGFFENFFVRKKFENAKRN